MRAWSGMIAQRGRTAALQCGSEFDEKRRRGLQASEERFAPPVEDVPADVALPHVREGIGERRSEEKVSAIGVEHSEQFPFERLVEPGRFEAAGQAFLITVLLLIEDHIERG